MTAARSLPRLFGAAEVCLGRQRSPQHDVGPHMVPYLRAANVKDGRLDLSDVKSMNFEPSEQKTFMLRAGDILITEGSGSLGAVGASAVWNDELPGTVCFQNTLVRLRPRPGVSDGRYLGWWARAAYGSGEFASIASGANIYHISAERVKGLSAPLPSLEEQYRIADFLDTETRRLDGLTRVQRSVLSLLRERRLRVLEEVLVPTVCPGRSWKPLGHLTEYGRPVVYGIVLPGPNVDEGVPIIKGGDVAAGRLSLAELSKTTYEIDSGYARSRLRAGDIVTSIRGSVGEVAMVPAEIEGANLTQDAARIAPGESVDGYWLELILQAPSVEQQIRRRITGATITGINIWDLRRIRVPVVPLNSQIVATRRVNEVLATITELAAKTESQLALIAERRQAVITAAVTGQINVSTARGVDV